MKRLLLIALLMLAAYSPLAGRTVINAVSCARDHVEDAFEATGAGDTVQIPACSGGQSWTAGITYTFPDNVKIFGAGDRSVLGGGDQTVIVDNIVADTHILMLSGTGLRVAGLTVRGGSGGLKSEGNILIFGNNVRIDHNHFNSKTYSDGAAARGNKVLVMHAPSALTDHNIFDYYGESSIYAMNGGTDLGQTSWASDTNPGTESGYWFVEDNRFEGQNGLYASRIMDCFMYGSRVVIRFNDIGFTAGVEHHTTGASGENRGCRAVEQYNNRFYSLPSQSACCGFAPLALTAGDIGGGVMLLWGNEEDTTNGYVFKNGFQIRHTSRESSTTYPQGIGGVSSLGYAGPAPLASGTVNVASDGITVTRVSGPSFDTGWDDANHYNMIYITGANCTAVSGQQFAPLPACRIKSVDSANQLTLCTISNGCGLAGNDTGTGGALTNAVYQVGSVWDGNQNSGGWPILDQPGRGKGELIIGGVFTNNLRLQSTGLPGWPNQLLEPVRVWMNVLTPMPGWGGSLYPGEGGDIVMTGREFFPAASGIQVSDTEPFNGTQAVVGWGSFDNMPDDCEFDEAKGAGPAYWAKDVGDWNTSTSNTYGPQRNGEDGMLYTCTADGVWTLTYEPSVYPHSLNINDGGGGEEPPPVGPVRIRRTGLN